MKKIDLFNRKFDYSWVVIGICFAMVFTSLGLCSSGRTLYLTAITEALDIPRSAFSINDTFRFVTTTIVNLFFGTLVNKFGTKKLICAGFLCLIGFALINSFATSLIAFYFAGILLGIGLSWTTTTMVSTVINKWCTSNKATVTGAVLAANGIGGAIAVQLLSPIIFEEGNPFGYRTSYRLVSLILTVVLVLVVMLYKNPPVTDDNIKIVSSKKKIRGTGWVGMEYTEAIKKPYFYVALACMFLTGMTLQGLGGIGVPHMYDIGMDKDFVALIVSLGGLMLTLTKFLTGFFYDRFGIKVSMYIALFAAFVSVGILAFLENTTLGRIMAFVRLIIGSFATPLETVMLPIFAVEFFGNKPFEKLIGIFVSVSAAGFAFGSPLANLCYDILGSYKIAFIIFALLMVIVTIGLQYVLKASRRDRQLILNSL